LIECGGFSGYEADAVLLHFESRNEHSSPEEFAAIRYLKDLMEMGSGTADRILTLLNREPYVREMYGG